MLVVVSFLITAGTCTNKCNVHVYYLHNTYTYYYIPQVFVKIGSEQTVTLSICQPSNILPATMYINCLSWNKGKSHTCLNNKLLQSKGLF